MKKLVKVVGITHRKGEKNGRPYEFYMVNGTCDAPYTDGLGVISATIPETEVGSIVIGNEYEMITSYYAGREKIEYVIG